LWLDERAGTIPNVRRSTFRSGLPVRRSRGRSRDVAT
jgi:hypothetical protein